MNINQPFFLFYIIIAGISVTFFSCDNQSSSKNNEYKSIQKKTDADISRLNRNNQNTIRSCKKDTIFYSFTNYMTLTEGRKHLSDLANNDDNFSSSSIVHRTFTYPAGSKYESYDDYFFKMFFKGEPYYFKVLINDGDNLLYNQNDNYSIIPNALRRIIDYSFNNDGKQGDVIKFVDMITLNYSDINKNPINNVIDLYGKAYGNYQAESFIRHNYGYRAIRLDGKESPPPKVSDRKATENCVVYYWPSNPKIRIFYKNIRILKPYIEKDEKRKLPYNRYEITINYFSRNLLENIKFVEDSIKDAGELKKQLEKKLIDVI